jgi:VIT1/CCC1 family predicted Fe2+/Mn2+ transporter
MFARRFAGKHLDITDLLSEAVEAVYMVIIIGGYVALSQLNSEYLYIVEVNIGACIGWGVIDGLAYIISNAVDRGGQVDLVHKIQSERNTEKSAQDVIEEFDGTYLSNLNEESKKRIAEEISGGLAGVPVKKGRFATREDVAGFAAIVGIYLAAGIILSLPYFILPNKIHAWLISNIIGTIWLFFFGYRVAKITGGGRILIGLLTASAGLIFLFLSYHLWA